MARRKRRARMGSIQDTSMEVGGLLIGAFVGNLIKTFVPATVSPTIVDVAQVSGGVVGANYMKGFGRNVLLGFAVDGGSSLLSDVMGKAKATAVKGAVLNRRSNGVGAYNNGGGKLNAETSFEVI